MQAMTRTVQTAPITTPTPSRESSGEDFHRSPIAWKRIDHAEKQAILVLGTPERAGAVCERLRRNKPFATRIVAPSDLAQAAHWVSRGHVEAVVHVAPLDMLYSATPESHRTAVIEDAVATLCRATPTDGRVAQIAMLPSEFDSERVRGLYGLGLRAAFGWPADLEILPRLVKQVLTTQAAAQTDLDSVVRDRLESRFGERAHGVDVELSADRVYLSGSVDSLWLKRAIERDLNSLPGVVGVETSALTVRPASRSDGAIGREIRALIDSNSSLDARTLGLSVHDGNVVLMGTVTGDEGDAALESIAVVPGVRSVTDRTQQAPRGEKARQAALASHLEGIARRDAKADDLRVAVVKRTLVVRGVGTREQVKRAISSLRDKVAQSPVVAKVIDRVGPRLQAV